MHDAQVLLRTVLLQQLDGLRANFERMLPVLQEVPEALLHEPVNSVWKSIFGILDHVIADQHVNNEILESRTYYGAFWDALGGQSTNLSELAERQREVDARLERLIRSAEDLSCICYYQWEGTWRRCRFFHVVLSVFEHVMQHRGNVDQLLRDRNVSVPGNPIFEYVMNPGAGALLREDKVLFPVEGCKNQFDSFEAAYIKE